ncbi:MAG: hypothetical protein A2086_11655 [Spirochaetes bacterium GWD1_27_9]|nr:MAG: hypothetical protein A2Z98_12080 [Spirochaetes bacterium GWB1_27_13]OHD26446.1 MAG: hypothetical protein A2Y34_10075 [Spirochaetes bacterium GWC1_27_15]OHD36388.1 MAG: hypothetical protein A2086_11655 [Spirochaetes bacterium GWD1_27_9]
MKNLFNIKTSKIIGFYIFTVGLIILFKLLFLEQFKIIYIALFLLILPAIDFTVRGFRKKKRRSFLIPGITFLTGCLFFLVYIFFFNPNYGSLIKVWPVIGIFPALGLITYYIFTPKRDPRIIVPAIFFLFLSIVLLFFTTGIINFKFRYFLLLLLPFMVILVGLYLLFNNEIKNIKKNIDKNSDKK